MDVAENGKVGASSARREEWGKNGSDWRGARIFLLSWCHGPEHNSTLAWSTNYSTKYQWILSGVKSFWGKKQVQCLFTRRISSNCTLARFSSETNDAQPMNCFPSPNDTALYYWGKVTVCYRQTSTNQMVSLICFGFTLRRMRPNPKGTESRTAASPQLRLTGPWCCGWHSCRSRATLQHFICRVCLLPSLIHSEVRATRYRITCFPSMLTMRKNQKEVISVTGIYQSLLFVFFGKTRVKPLWRVSQKQAWGKRKCLVRHLPEYEGKPPFPSAKGWESLTKHLPLPSLLLGGWELAKLFYPILFNVYGNLWAGKRTESGIKWTLVFYMKSSEMSPLLSSSLPLCCCIRVITAHVFYKTL